MEMERDRMDYKCKHCGTKGIGIEQKDSYFWIACKFFFFVTVIWAISGYFQYYTFILIIAYLVYWKRKPRYRGYNCAICGQLLRLEKKN